MRSRLTALAALAAIVTVAPNDLVASEVPAELAQERRAIENYQAFDQYLQDIGWKIAHANAPYCDNAIPAVGLQLQDLRSYGDPELARAALGMDGDFAVQTVAAGSPAADFPALTGNREVTSLAGQNPNSWHAKKRRDWKRLTRANDLIDRELAEQGAVTITLAPPAKITLQPVQACATRFELEGHGDRAAADGSRVIIGVEHELFAAPEEQFAAMIAHELAHNLLRHRVWLDQAGRSNSNTQLIEREADRLMPWLLVNAGYEPRAAYRFMTSFKPDSGRFLVFEGTHDNWRIRAAAIEAEIALVEQALAEDGVADWATHFRRDIDPEPATSRDPAR